MLLLLLLCECMCVCVCASAFSLFLFFFGGGRLCLIVCFLFWLGFEFFLMYCVVHYLYIIPFILFFVCLLCFVCLFILLYFSLWVYGYWAFFLFFYRAVVLRAGTGCKKAYGRLIIILKIKGLDLISLTRRFAKRLIISRVCVCVCVCVRAWLCSIYVHSEFRAAHFSVQHACWLCSCSLTHLLFMWITGFLACIII